VTQQRRLHERHELCLPVVVLHDGAAYTGQTQNVSLGGMLITGDAGRVPFGAEVRVRVEASRPAIESEIEATVRWVKDGAIGVQFGSLRAKEQWALNQLLKSGAPD
jgi:type IV pilus assembly protein PilZ